MFCDRVQFYSGEEAVSLRYIAICFDLIVTTEGYFAFICIPVKSVIVHMTTPTFCMKHVGPYIAQITVEIDAVQYLEPI